MKKKLVLLITLIVSLFIYSGKVEAAKELTCIYDKSVNGDSMVMFVQHADGTFALFVNGKSNDISDLSWKQLKDFKLFTSFKIDEQEVKTTDFSECYKWIYNAEPGNRSKYILHNGDSDHSNVIYGEGGTIEATTYDHPFLEEKTGVPNIGNDEVDDKITSDPKLDDWKNKYNGKCVYSSGITLFFNDDKILPVYAFDEPSKLDFKFDFSINDFLLYNAGFCPGTIYVSHSFNYIDEALSEYDIHTIKFSLLGGGGSFDLQSGTEYTDSYKNKISQGSGKKTPIDSCRDLIGDDVFEKINEYFSVIKIVIPILLIGFGIFDFSKAVFGNDDDMKKAKKKFIMRIVAAVLFFLFPVFIKLILTIANKAWDFIKTDTCIK